MATIKKKHVKAVIQLRRANEAEWIAHDPILRDGEPALSKDVYKLKIGDGERHWSEIDYLNESEFESIRELIENLRVEDLVDGEDYATKEYVDENGGKINSITVNGVVQPIDENKNVNITGLTYTAGNGIVISQDSEISLDDLILDCGTSTTEI